MSRLPSSLLVASPQQQGLDFECAVMAGRLAVLLRQRFGGDETPVAAALGFLDHQYQLMAGNSSLSENRALVKASRDQGNIKVLDRLCRALGLSEVETDLLILAGLAEQHEGYADIYRSLHPSGQPYPTAGLAAQLLSPSEQRWDLAAQLAGGVLVDTGLLELRGDTAFYLRHLVLNEALWPVLGGIDAWPQGVRPVRDVAVLSGLIRWLGEASVARATRALKKELPCTIVISTDNSEVAWQRAIALVQAAGGSALRFGWPKDPGPGFESLVLIHSLARGGVPVISLPDTDTQVLNIPVPLTGYPGPVILCGHLGNESASASRAMMNIQVERLEASDRRDMWREILPDLAEHADVLAARYPLEPAAAAQLAADLALLRDDKAKAFATRDVAKVLRARAAVTLGGGVQRVRPAAGWSQLVLPELALTQLKEAVNRLDLQAQVLDEWRFLEGRHGARGVRMLFAGPPGTGKSLSAEVLANVLGVDLLLVDLSRVVSKWIGETEKNLAEVFKTAERAKAVLFFDEADALFGKRTEVSDSHDRYANLETAYLLSRLERFDGLAILATNLRQNIDSAFTRRLEFVVEYEEPAFEQRLALWRCHLPKNAPLADDVNLVALATQHPIVGGLIRNAAVAAAFLAAGEHSDITNDHFIRAIRREYEKSGKAYRELPGRTHGKTRSS